MTSISFNQDRMQIHVAEPGATAVISGTWDGPPDSQFSLRGVTSTGHWDALDATWRIEAPHREEPGEPSVKGTWDATVRFYRTGTTDLTVRLISRDAPPLVAQDTAQAEVTMDARTPDLQVLQPRPTEELPVGPQGAVLPCQVQSRSDLGPRTVSWELQKIIRGRVANDQGTDLWTGTLDVAPAPLGLQPLTVTVRCAQAPDVTNSVAVPLTLVKPDVIAPVTNHADARMIGELPALPPNPIDPHYCGPEVRPSFGIDPLNGPLAPGQQVTISGWSDPGEVPFWNAADNACDSRPMVTFTGVTVTLDNGQQVAATSTDQWASWSATVTFPPGKHTATASAATTGGATYSATTSVLVAPAPTLTVTARPLARPLVWARSEGAWP